jgi:hypothetical protein
MDDLIQQGVDAYKSGDHETARKLLTEAIQLYPNNERAWGWMCNVCTNDQERILCLKQMVRINPDNQNTRKELMNLENKIPISPKPTGSQDVKLNTKLHAVGEIQKPGPQKKLLLFGSIGLVLLLIIGGVVFIGSLNKKNYATTDQLIPSLAQTKVEYSLSPITKEIQPSLTPRYSLAYTRTPRPSLTAYPTNTLFVLPTWTGTPTNVPPTQIPSPIPAQNPSIVEQLTLPTESEPDQPPEIIPTTRSIPSKTPKPNITISCDVSPNVIQVGTNTTLTIFAQLYQDGKAIKTMALVAEWEDYQGRKFHCVSQGDTCQGQSGYLVAHVESIINLAAQADINSRLSCQATYRTP